MDAACTSGRPNRAAGATRRPPRAHWLLPAALFIVLPHRHASAQLITRYFPANIPAYQDWSATLDTSGAEEDQLNGVRVGSFVIQPNILESIGYDTNPLGRPAAVGSSVLNSTGAVSINSDWSRNALAAAVTVNDARYFNLPRLSFTAWTASVGGVVDYGDDEIRLGYDHINSSSLPTDAGTFGLNAPITDRIDDARVSDTIGPGPLTLVPAVVGQLYRFNGLSAGPGIGLSGLSNRNVINPSLTAGYEFAGGHNLLVTLNDEYVTYPGGDAAGLTPSYNDVSMLVGIEYRQSALLVYRVLGGYEERFLQGGRAGNRIAAPAAELDAIWTPTVLLSLTASVSEGLQDEPTTSGQGVRGTNALLNLQYAFRRDIMLSSYVQYARTGATTTQVAEDVISAGAQATWKVSRRLGLSLRYDFAKGEESAPQPQNYTRHQILLQANFQL
jgi:hypothetical protein